MIAFIAALRRVPRIKACVWGLPFLVLIHASALHAQAGGLFLLAPFGARAVGMGEAVAADTALGAEGMWWNPAALSRVPSKEIALHNSSTVPSINSNMLTFVMPSRVIGTLALAGYSVDYGDQEATDRNTGQTIGLISIRNYLFGASYSTPIGKRLSLGLTYKYVIFRAACSGTCGEFPVLSGATSAVDAGAQYVVPSSFPITLGLSIRNVGPKFQIKDQPQADPLPRVMQFGASSRLPIASFTAAGASLDVSTDIIRAPSTTGISDETNFGVGTAIGYRDQYFLRAGYKKRVGLSGEPSIGFGIQRGAFGLDFARRIESLGSQVGNTPTFITLRARF